MSTLVRNYVGGGWRDSSATETLADHQPRLGRGARPRAALHGAHDVDAAVQAAKAAFPMWRATPAPVRARVLFRLKALLEEHKEELARQLTIEHGKVIAETRGEVQRGIENVEHACGIPTLMMGDTVEEIAPGIDSSSWRQPLGVFAVITPYNFPVMIPLWFWPYAVATGNTVVLKPSEQDPLTHQRIVELAEQAGLPPGVLNVVHGGRASRGGDLRPSRHRRRELRRLEPRRGDRVPARVGQAGKRVQALGGAKNYMIVLPDADMDLTLEACSELDLRLLGAALPRGEHRRGRGRRARRDPRADARRGGADPARQRARRVDRHGPGDLGGAPRAREGVHHAGRRGRREALARRARRDGAPASRAATGSARRSSRTSRPTSRSARRRSSARWRESTARATSTRRSR
jgi:hypothetical protein